MAKKQQQQQQQPHNTRKIFDNKMCYQVLTEKPAYTWILEHAIEDIRSEKPLGTCMTLFLEQLEILK